jgi:hypothetical protein
MKRIPLQQDEFDYISYKWLTSSRSRTIDFPFKEPETEDEKRMAVNSPEGKLLRYGAEIRQMIDGEEIMVSIFKEVEDEFGEMLAEVQASVSGVPYVEREGSIFFGPFPSNGTVQESPFYYTVRYGERESTYNDLIVAVQEFLYEEDEDPEKEPQKRDLLTLKIPYEEVEIGDFNELLRASRPTNSPSESLFKDKKHHKLS